MEIEKSWFELYEPFLTWNKPPELLSAQRLEIDQLKDDMKVVNTVLLAVMKELPEETFRRLPAEVFEPLSKFQKRVADKELPDKSAH